MLRTLQMIQTTRSVRFSPVLAFRALAAYSLLRTLSLELRLSPFTPNVFLRALNLPYPSRLLGQVHVALLRVLLPSLNMGYTHRLRGGYAGVIKRRKVDGFRLELRAGDNLTYLDSFTWPLFYDDYVHLTADILHSYINDKELHVDYRVLVPRNSADDTGMKNISGQMHIVIIKKWPCEIGRAHV